MNKKIATSITDMVINRIGKKQILLSVAYLADKAKTKIADKNIVSIDIINFSIFVLFIIVPKQPIKNNSTGTTISNLFTFITLFVR